MTRLALALAALITLAGCAARHDGADLTNVLIYDQNHIGEKLP